MSNDKYLAAAGIACDWPNGRGCYISKDEDFLIWVGEKVRKMMDFVIKTMNFVLEMMNFVFKTMNF